MNLKTALEHIERLEREIEQLHQEIRNMQKSHISELEALEYKLQVEKERADSELRKRIREAYRDIL